MEGLCLSREGLTNSHGCQPWAQWQEAGRPGTREPRQGWPEPTRREGARPQAGEGGGGGRALAWVWGLHSGPSHCLITKLSCPVTVTPGSPLGSLQLGL